MKTSFSAVSSWRTCQQQYHYTYAEGLQPKVEATAPLLGRMLHSYLESFYRSLKDGYVADTAHKDSVTALREGHAEKLEGLVFAAVAAGEEALAKEFEGLLSKAERIAERYFVVRGQHDAGLTILMIEERLEFALDDGISSNSVVDLVTQDNSGSAYVWEHKTSGGIPGQRRRLKDLQTTLLSAALEEFRGLQVNGIIWNYLRTQEPTVPRLLKEGGLSKRSDLCSTWETYLREIGANCLDVNDYLDVKQRLAGKEQEEFFPRIELPLLQSEHILLRDMIASARSIKAIYESGGTFTPVRNVGTHCDWCQYSKLCEAVILGGDDEELKERLFTRKERKKKEEHSDSEW